MRCDEVIRELSAPTDDRDGAALADHLAACASCAGWARLVDRLDRVWDATRPVEPSPGTWDGVWANIERSLAEPAAAHSDDVVSVGSRSARNGVGTGISIAATTVAPSAAPRVKARRAMWGVLAGFGLVGLGQAAALLIAFGLAWQTPPPAGDAGPRAPAPELADRSAPSLPAPVRSSNAVQVDADIPEGRLMMITAKGTEPWLVQGRLDVLVPGISGLVRTEIATTRMVDVTPPEMYFGSDGGLVILNAMEYFARPEVAAR